MESLSISHILSGSGISDLFAVSKYKGKGVELATAGKKESGPAIIARARTTANNQSSIN